MVKEMTLWESFFAVTAKDVSIYYIHIVSLSCATED